MKKYLAICILCVLMTVLFGACYSSPIQSKLSSYQWKLEDISYLDGTDIADINKDEMRQVTLVFEENTFTLTDQTNSKIQTGTYLAEKASGSPECYKLDISFDDSQNKAIGVYGIRRYVDGSVVATVTIPTEDKVFSFVAE